MPRRKRWGGTGLKHISGFAAGQVAVKCWRCYKCGDLYNQQPGQCGNCGSILFDQFDSRGEARRWGLLIMKEVGGLIENLRRQVTIPLHAAGKRGLPVEVGKYIADFTYDRDGEYIIEDFKGAITDLASWKLRHVFAEYGVRVKLTTEKDL